MDEMNQTWDDRLDEHGIDAVTWQQGDDFGRAHTRTLKIMFKEIVPDERGDNRVTIAEELVANDDQGNYSIVQVPPEMEQRGIENVWVDITRQPYPRSKIHIKLRDIESPIVIFKRY